MNCIDCGRPLQQGEEKYCTYCRNKRDEKIKTGVKIGTGAAAALAATAVALWKIFGRKK